MIEVYYLDTSAAVKLIRREKESADLSRELALASETRAARFISSHLLATELRRVAHRIGHPQEKVTRILEGVNLVDLGKAYLNRAASYEMHIKTLDALHLATAEFNLGEGLSILTFDAQMITAARSMGIKVTTLVDGRLHTSW